MLIFFGNFVCQNGVVEYQLDVGFQVVIVGQFSNVCQQEWCIFFINDFLSFSFSYCLIDCCIDSVFWYSKLFWDWVCYYEVIVQIVLLFYYYCMGNFVGVVEMNVDVKWVGVVEKCRQCFSLIVN